MNNDSCKEIYFSILQILTKTNYCPYEDNINFRKKCDKDCEICISEFFINSNMIAEYLINEVLGE